MCVDGMLHALCDHEFERSNKCDGNHDSDDNNNNNNNRSYSNNYDNNNDDTVVRTTSINKNNQCSANAVIRGNQCQ